MVKAYLVNCGLVSESEGIYDAYMTAREEMFGYPQMPAQLLIPVDSAVRLENAPPGLVATCSEAEQLLQLMAAEFPNRSWTIEEYCWEDAIDICWGRAT